MWHSRGLMWETAHKNLSRSPIGNPPLGARFSCRVNEPSPSRRRGTVVPPTSHYRLELIISNYLCWCWKAHEVAELSSLTDTLIQAAWSVEQHLNFQIVFTHIFYSFVMKYRLDFINFFFKICGAKLHYVFVHNNCDK